MSELAQLLKISSEPISADNNLKFPDHFFYQESEFGIDINSKLWNELGSMLQVKNGYLAFESALHVFSTFDTPLIDGLFSWNSPSGWRGLYENDITQNLLFFAQDVFASQFAIASKGIFRFYPESGELEHHSNTLEEWATKILHDYSYEVGWNIAHDWQEQNKFSLGAEYRLLPKKPFILGGEYNVENLVAIESHKAMEKLGGLFRQIKNVPNGESVKIRDWI